MMGIERIGETVQKVLSEHNLAELTNGAMGQSMESLRAMLDTVGRSDVFQQLQEQIEALPTDAEPEVVDAAAVEADDAELIQVEAAGDEPGPLSDMLSSLRDVMEPVLETVQNSAEAGADAQLEIIDAGAAGGAAVDAIEADDGTILTVESDGPAPVETMVTEPAEDEVDADS